ncbi:MAG: threonine synthase [Pseudomonadota bacterium]
MTARPRPAPDKHYCVSHMDCGATGERHDPEVLHNTSRAGKPLLVRYDLERVAAAVTPADLAARDASMWRYRELLPIRRAGDIVSLGEPITPLLALERTAKRLGGGTLLVKDESRMPTGSFKARGLAVAVSMLKSFGVERAAMPTAGNAGAALAAYCACADIESHIFMPDDAPDVTMRETGLYGADVWRVNGLINHCGEIVAANREAMGWYDVSTLKEPYRLEGKKTMALELAEQLGWRAPDVIFYPTGGGTGLIGMWKGFLELKELGWLKGDPPRMVAVQSTRCGPLVKAFDEGKTEVEEPWSPVTTTLHGVRVPKPFADTLCLETMRDSGGFGSAVDDDEVEDARLEVARADGVHLGPEGAACFVAYRQELARGRIGANDRVVLFNCASGLKSEMPAVSRTLDRHAAVTPFAGPDRDG